MNKSQYVAFIDALAWENHCVQTMGKGYPYFEGCLPIEVMAKRGPETLRFGPMKPVGLAIVLGQPAVSWWYNFAKITNLPHYEYCWLSDKTYIWGTN